MKFTISQTIYTYSVVGLWGTSHLYLIRRDDKAYYRPSAVRPHPSAGVRCRPLSVQVVWFVRPLCGRTNVHGQRTDDNLSISLDPLLASGRMRTDSERTADGCGRTADGQQTDSVFGARTIPSRPQSFLRLYPRCKIMTLACARTAHGQGIP